MTMSSEEDISRKLRRELDETRARLAEAEEALNAIRNGEVDGLIMAGPKGKQIFTLTGAQEPYRLLIEQMSEGALTLSRTGFILYANQTFARLLQVPLERVMGAEFRAFVAAADQLALADLIAAACGGSSQGELSVRAADGLFIPLRLGLSRLQLDPETLVCVVATDLTEVRKKEDELRQLYGDLETRVEARTAELAASRLLALNLAEESTKARNAVEAINHDLKHEIAGRERAEQALRDSLNEKESLLKEIHHRVKNNLQIVSSLLRLQSVQVNHSIAKAALMDMQNRVRSMALIHEHLYNSANLSQVDMATYLKNLCSILLRAMVARTETIQLHLDLVPVQLRIDQAIPCGLIANELLSNSLKHAFPEGRTGEVRVELKPVEDSPGLRLRVADTGVGLPADFDLDHLASLGLGLVSDLIRQIGGRLEIGHGAGKGSESRGAVFDVVFTPKSPLAKGDTSYLARQGTMEKRAMGARINASEDEGH